MFPARTSPSGEGTNTATPAPNRPPAYTKFAPHPLRYPPSFHSIPPPPPIMHTVGMMATPHMNPVFVHSNQNPNPYYFDATRFVCDKKVTDKQHMSKPRYLDIERERQVTRWLMEANEALTQQEKNHKYRSPTKKKPFLRRFHSHDSNRQSEHWSDNFILMDNVHPKKTAALLRRFQSQTRDASPCERPTEPNPIDRTGSLDSKEAGTSKNASPLSTNERSSENNSSKTGSGVSGSRTYMLKDFVEKYSLPRVVKLDDDERPVLLYRCFESHTKVEAVQVSGKKGKAVGKPIYIPEGYGGWFSVCTCRGGVLARPRSTVAQLVRARAPGLVCARALSAYRARQENDPSRPGGGGGQYERSAARAGGALRLAAVFADGGKAKAPRYAQLLDSHANELFVPLNTKGEFYEVCMEEISKIPFAEHLEATGDSIPEQLLPEDKERVHQLSHLLSVCRLPVRVKLIAGPVPIEMAQDIGDDMLLTAVITEPVLVMCTLPDYGSTPSSPTKPAPDRANAREALKFISLNSNIKVRRTQLGYETEKRMFLSTRLQKALSFCQMNVDNWIRHISYVSTENSALSGSLHTRVKTAEELLKERSQEQLQAQAVKFEKERKFTLQGLKIDTSRLFGKSDKVLKDIPDENEGSIIFLSKNELEHMNYEVYSDEEAKEESKLNEIKKADDEVKQKQFAADKMQVFREDSEHPKRNKWFKHLKLLKSTEKLTDEKITALEKSQKGKEIRDPFDPFAEKHSSIERYQDMAKLIEDRFGATRKTDAISEKCHSYKSSTTTSDLENIQSPAITKKHILTKSVSVQTGMTDTLLMQKETATNLKHIRKNLSVDRIDYCGSMESDSSNRKLKSLDENMLKKTSASKSASNLDKRQRIQPDLIPDNKGMIKSESYNQIRSCEEINMFGLGSMYNDSDFEINYKQHSYITEKLCSEFHVKTKRVLSKSTSNLLHGKKLTEAKKEGTNSMPTKSDMHAHPDSSEKVNFRRRQEKMRDSTPSLEIEVELHQEDGNDSKNQAKLRRSISSIQKRKLPVIEDLPYGQVADAVGEAEEKIDSDTNSDNIYAEICNPTTVILNEDENEQYDFNTDILANDPIISNVKKEVISRNDERIKQMANDTQGENPFRHIEVVVIENNTEFTSLGNQSESSSDYGDEDFDGSKNDLSQDSWERDKCTDQSADSKMHAIRLEITSNADEFPDFGKDDSTDRRNVRLSKEANLSFVHDIHLSGTYPNVPTSEAIYNTLK